MIRLRDPQEYAATNYINAVLGALLIAMPWLAGFADNIAALTSVVISGAAIVTLSLGAAKHLDEWEDWIVAAIGIWAALSPWAMGFTGLSETALWSIASLGIATALLALIEIWRAHHGGGAARA